MGTRSLSVRVTSDVSAGTTSMQKKNMTSLKFMERPWSRFI